MNKREKIEAVAKSPNIDRAAWAFVGVACFLYLARTDGLLPFAGADNAYYILLAKSLAEGHGYREAFAFGSPAHTQFPPMFPLILSLVVRLFGTSVFAMSLVVSAFAGAAIALSYLFFKRAGFPYPFVAPAWLALSCKFFIATDDILSEAAFMAFVMAAMCASQAFFESRKTKWAVAAALCCWCALMTRTAGVVLPVAMAAGIFLNEKDRKRAALASTAALAVLYLPLVGWAIRNAALSGATTDYAAQFFAVDPYDPLKGTVGPVALAARFLKSAQYYIADIAANVLPSDVPEKTAANYAIGALLWCAICVGMVVRIRRKPSAAEAFILLFVGMALAWPFLDGRFIVPAYPFLFAYAAVGIKSLNDATHSRSASWGKWAARSAAMILALTLAANLTWDVRYRLYKSEIAPMAFQIQPGVKTIATRPAFIDLLKALSWMKHERRVGCTVVTRKPSLVALADVTPVIGVPSPLPSDPWAWLAEKNVCYVIVDRIANASGEFAQSIANKAPSPDAISLAFRLDNAMIMEIDPRFLKPAK